MNRFFHKDLYYMNILHYHPSNSQICSILNHEKPINSHLQFHVHSNSKPNYNSHYIHKFSTFTIPIPIPIPKFSLQTSTPNYIHISNFNLHIQLHFQSINHFHVITKMNQYTSWLLQYIYQFSNSNLNPQHT